MQCRWLNSNIISVRILVIALMVTLVPIVRPIGMSAGHHHAKTKVHVSMELRHIIAVVQTDLLVNSKVFFSAKFSLSIKIPFKA